MFDYYFELLSKPKYMLSESETMFIEVFPLAILAGVCAVVVLVVWVIGLIKRGKKINVWLHIPRKSAGGSETEPPYLV